MKSVILVLTLLTAGCSFSPRGFDHAALGRAARVDRHTVSDADIASAVALRPQLTFPFRLAVWFRPPGQWPWSEHRLHWQDEDRTAILNALRPLQDAGIVAEAFVLHDSVFPADNVRAARFAAALQRADAVLIVTGASAVARYSNPAALLYPTVVGLWVAPGSHAVGVCLATGSLWDVRSGFLYATAEEQATWTQTVPVMHVDEDLVVESAKKTAVASLARALELRLRKLGAAPAP